MKKLIGLLIIPLLLAAPVLAASLGISPSHTELEVPGNGSATADFQVYYFDGDLQISLVDIPLRVEPETIYVEALSEPVDIQITIYGDNSLGSQVYDGYVEFLGMTGGTVAVAIDVKATVNHIVAGQPLPEEIPSEEAPSPQGEAGGWLNKIAALSLKTVIIIVGGLILLGLIVLSATLAKRRRY